jgi:hypothetical protein
MVLNRASRKEVDARLQALRRQVSLQVFTLRYEDGSCREARQAAEELAEATSRLSVDISDAMESGDLLRKYRVDSPPALVVTAKDSPELRVYGVPVGYGLIALLDAIVSLGVPQEPKAELMEAFEAACGDQRECSGVRLDLVASRRDHATVEASAALWRVAFAARAAEEAPKPVVALRLIEDSPLWVVRSGAFALPALLVEGEPVLAWPFTDTEIAGALSASVRS